MDMKTRMFDAGVEALGIVAPGIEEEHGELLYCCPLCTRGFPRRAIDDGWLTAEHVPPRAAGGRKMCLTCRECNSRAGSDLEADLLKNHHWRRFARQEKGLLMPGAIDLGGTIVRGEIEVADGGLKFTSVSKQNDPRVVTQALGQLSSEPAASSEIAVSPIFHIDYRERRVTAGWLKSGFLVAFSAFGYRYACTSGLALMRQQIECPDDEIIPMPVVWAAQHVDPVLVRVTAPEELRGLLVSFGRDFVFLPWGEPEEPYYRRVDEYLASRVGLTTVEGEPQEWPVFPRYQLDFGR